MLDLEIKIAMPNLLELGAGVTEAGPDFGKIEGTPHYYSPTQIFRPARDMGIRPGNFF